MLKLVEGNILEADVMALVNTVNTVGIMGKGIALQFSKAFPDMFIAYKAACEAGEVVPGKMHVFDRGPGMFNPRYIINFPTKRHWRGKSRIEDIEAGLRALVAEIRAREIGSIAIPPLGCGHGGLRWGEVYPLIESAMSALREIEVLVFKPTGAPRPEEMLNRTPRPEMTPSRARVLRVLSEYRILGYELTLLEVHKLLYFLQIAGEPLQLRFEKGRYGPYADNLRHVLNLFEGHFLRGFGDGSGTPRTPIQLMSGAVEEATKVSASTSTLEHENRVKRVYRLIEGFESPYGMELLASVHWVATNSSSPCSDVETAIDAVHAWNDRKQRVMKSQHIRLAWNRLQSEGWLAMPS